MIKESPPKSSARGFASFRLKIPGRNRTTIPCNSQSAATAKHRSLKDAHGKPDHDFIDDAIAEVICEAVEITYQRKVALGELLEATPGYVDKPNDSVPGFRPELKLAGKFHRARIRSHDEDVAEIPSATSKALEEEPQAEAAPDRQTGASHPERQQEGGRHHPDGKEDRQQGYAQRCRARLPGRF